MNFYALFDFFLADLVALVVHVLHKNRTLENTFTKQQDE